MITSYESNSGGEREIQRTMLELLNQLDGFDSRGDVKVSNREGNCPY
jgi:26S proteasome regulatory subunit T2